MNKNIIRDLRKIRRFIKLTRCGKYIKVHLVDFYEDLHSYTRIDANLTKVERDTVIIHVWKLIDVYGLTNDFRRILQGTTYHHIFGPPFSFDLIMNPRNHNDYVDPGD